MIALVLAGRGDEETDAVPAGTPMRVAGVNVRTLQAGACQSVNASALPVQSAVIQISIRVSARDDENATLAVFLDVGGGVAPARLVTGPFPIPDFGYGNPVVTPPVWANDTDAVALFEYTGLIENGPKSPTTVNWAFLVGLLPGADNDSSSSKALASVIRVPWSRTYGTCG